MGARLRPEARRRQAVAAAKRAREVRRLAVADQPRDVRDRQRGLLEQQPRSHRHAPRAQVLVERRLAKLRIRPLQLPRRARQRASHDRQGQLTAVVTRHDHARQQIQAPALDERVGTHAPLTDAR